MPSTHLHLSGPTVVCGKPYKPATAYTPGMGGFTLAHALESVTCAQCRAGVSLPVIFRAERSGDFKGDVTAVFPTLPGTYDPWTFTVYAHVGQHGTGARPWYWTTRPARPDEFADLLAELRGIYEQGEDPVKLEVRHRITQAHDAARRAELRRMDQAAERMGKSDT